MPRSEGAGGGEFLTSAALGALVPPPAGPRRGRPTPAAVGAWLSLAGLLMVACSEPSQVESLERRGRFGSLRDLVLFDPFDLDAAGALFVDRFEATRGDWREFADTSTGQRVGAERIALTGDPALPVVGISLVQARVFAQWRFLRLPRREDWELAVHPGGRSIFPWGDREDPSRANTLELGLADVTPVGTFESGRRAGADQPYDLIGNVGEWTESVPAAWWSDSFDPRASLAVLQRSTLQVPALAAWAGPAGRLPLACLAEVGGDVVPREVVGASFQTPMAVLVEAHPAADRRRDTGVRLVATARELLLALADDPVVPSAVEQEQLRRFVARGGHRLVLQAAWPLVVATVGLRTPVAVLLDAELTAPLPEAGR